MKKIKKILSIIILLFMLASCSNSNGDEIIDQDVDKLIEKDIQLKNMSNEYILKDDKIKTYFYKNGTVPFIGIKEFISSLDGYFITSKINYSFDNDVLTLSWTNEEDELWLKLDCETDLITVNNGSFFSFVDEPEGIDYYGHFDTVNTYYNKGENIIFNLRKYDFDLMKKDDDVIVPFNVLNTLFLMNNIGNMFYNGNKYYFVSSYLDDPNIIKEIREESNVTRRLPDDLIEARNNGLYFVLDYFYGLKDIKNIDNFKDYIARSKYGSKIYNSKPNRNEDGLVDLFIRDLDDPHTSMGYRSYYSSIGLFEDIYVPYYFEDFGYRTRNIVEKSSELADLYTQTFLNQQLVRYEGNTAFLKFDEFNVGYDDEIFDSDGNVKEDAWKFDTYYLMQKGMNEIKNHKGIKNVVIDLSNNGGGVISGCYSALGFLTNKNLLIPARDSLTKEEMIEELRVDTNGDNNFDDNDAYDEFNYYVLVSNATYSAANYFTSICKDMQLATIIGEKSGGGMCGVDEIVLLDGTTVSFSSNFCLNGGKIEGEDIKLHDIEFGIDVDKNIPLNKFYDLKYINNLINN